MRLSNMLPPALLLLAAMCSRCLADIAFPSYISSSMLFQRNAPFIVSGTDTPHSSLSAIFAGHSYSAVADQTGAFSFSFPPQNASTVPVSITFSSSSGAHASLEDVLFGDVFLSSGQSNMQSYVSWQYNFSDIVAAAPKYSALIRIAQVAMLQQYCNATQPEDNLTMSIPWTRANPDVIPAMSAIAYLTAVQLLIHNPSVPVGAIASSWGGTAMEPWMPAEALKECGQLHADDVDPAEHARHAATGAAASAVDIRDFPDKASVLWNSMIHPLTRLSIAGVYWSTTPPPTLHFCNIHKGIKANPTQAIPLPS
jgi:sialate O-acetylesterase